jgi:hypothetical protein
VGVAFARDRPAELGADAACDLGDGEWTGEREEARIRHG